MLDRVRVLYVDNSLSSTGARTLDVRVSSSKSFTTPTRPISVHELSAKNFLGYRGEIYAPIAAFPTDLYGKRFERFMKNNGLVKDTRRALQSKSDCTFKTPSFPILQLPPLDPKDVVPFKIAFDMQQMIDGMDYVCVPLMKSNVREYEETVEDWCNSSEEFGKGAVPQLSLDEDPRIFSDKLNILSEMSKSGQINIINLRYTSIEKSMLQLVALWSKRESIEAIINCSEVPTHSGPTSVSGIDLDVEEYLIQHGIDSITRKKVTVGQKFMARRNFQDPPTSLDDLDAFKFALHDASLRLSKNIWESIPHLQECNCSICCGMNRELIVDKFAYKDNGELEPSGLRLYSKLHDHQSDIEELNVMRDYIRTDSMSEYETRMKERQDAVMKQAKCSK